MTRDHATTFFLNCYSSELDEAIAYIRGLDPEYEAVTKPCGACTVEFRRFLGSLPREVHTLVRNEPQLAYVLNELRANLGEDIQAGVAYFINTLPAVAWQWTREIIAGAAFALIARWQQPLPSGATRDRSWITSASQSAGLTSLPPNPNTVGVVSGNYSQDISDSSLARATEPPSYEWLSQYQGTPVYRDTERPDLPQPGDMTTTQLTTATEPGVDSLGNFIVVGDDVLTLESGETVRAGSQSQPNQPNQPDQPIRREVQTAKTNPKDKEPKPPAPTKRRRRTFDA